MPLPYYKCDRCKTSYATCETAEKCEKSHFSAVFVKEIAYSIGPYPIRVAIIFADGYEVEYMIDDCSRRRSDVCNESAKTG